MIGKTSIFKHKNTQNKAFWCIFLVVVMVFINSISMVSAWDFDNILNYEKGDLKVTITNAFNLPLIGYDIGTIELKSHKSVDEVLKVGYGKEEVVMYYDFTGWELYKDGLGKVYFTDVRTGKEIEKEYTFVEWTSKMIEVNDYQKFCNLLKNGTSECYSKVVGTHLEEKWYWKDYIERDIPNRNTRIGLKTYVDKGDYIDAVWTIAGRKIRKHASWTAGLNNGLVGYYSLNESAGSTMKDWTGNYDGTYYNNLPTQVSGLANETGYAQSFDNTALDYGKIGDYSAFEITGDLSIQLWLKDTDLSQIRFLFERGGSGEDEVNNTIYEAYVNTDGNITFFQEYGAGTNEVVTTTNAIVTANEKMLLHIIRDDTAKEWKVYKNGTNIENVSYTNSATGGTEGRTYLGIAGTNLGDSNRHFSGVMDEFVIWNRILSGSEIQDLWNNGEGLNYGTIGVLTTLNSPIDTYNSTSRTITFNGTVSSDVGIANVSLIINGNYNETNTSGLNGDYIFTKTLSDGNYNWTYEACNINSVCVNATVRTFSIDTTPFIQFESPTYANDTNSISPYIPVNVSLTETYYKNITFDFYNANGTLISYSFTDTTRFINNSFADGIYYYNVTVWTTTGQTNSTKTRKITIDSIPPKITILAPPTIIDFHVVNENLYFNWSANDTHLDSCWYNYGGINTTVVCADNTTTINITNSVNKTIIFYANDTFGHLNTTTRTWNYKVFKNSETYAQEVTEGSSNTFSINITNGAGYSTTLALLNYNGTNYAGSISNDGQTNVISKTINAPIVSNDENITFFWNFSISDDTFVSSSQKNQTILNFDIDNCSINSNVLYNFTIVNEELQTILNANTYNTSGKIDLQIYTIDRNNLIETFSSSFNKINPFGICLSSSLSSGEKYLVDYELEYSAYGYAKEFYHEQNSTITSLSLPTNITLYDLNSSDSQSFKIITRDSSFLPLTNTLIKVQRKYVDEGVFKNVEIPITDGKGESIANLVIDTVIYNLILTKNGTTIGSFNNVHAICQNPTITSCTIELNVIPTTITIPDYSSTEDFNYTISYNKTSKIIESLFEIPSETVSTVILNVTTTDSLRTQVCTDTLTSTSGTLSCTVPDTFGNTTVLATIYRDGEFQAYGSINLNPTPSDIYGVALTFLSLVILLTLIGAGLSDNPVYTIIFFMVGVILLYSLNLVAGNGFIGGTATILWLIVAIIILLIKGGKRS